MNFLPEAIENYATAHTQNESELLAQLNRETYAKVLAPRMLSGHLQGRALAIFSHMIRPDYILEIGTYTGYSALCLAEGLTENGQLHTIDINDELSGFHEKYFGQSPDGAKIHSHYGNALEIIPALNHPWNLVFIDADKENYLNYYNLLLPGLKPGAWIIADNVLWSGKVTQPDAGSDKETQGILAFNTAVQNDSRVENILLPIRDGLMVLRKK